MENSKVRPDSDCYYYYYSSCSKGNRCPFRHEPAALKNETVCTYWLKGRCVKSHCTFRHMNLNKDRSKIPCFYESQPSGCEKPQCPFLHKSDSKSSLLGTYVPNSKSSNGKSFEGRRNENKSGYKKELYSSTNVKSNRSRGKTTHRGAKSLQNLVDSPIVLPFSQGRQTATDLTGPNLAKCLSKFDGYEATLLTLFRNFKYRPEFIEELIMVNNLSFELFGELVSLRPQVNICLSHLKVTGCRYTDSCYCIHMCLKYLIGDCLDKDCIYGHDWHTNHNKKVLKEFNLSGLSIDKLTHLFKTVVIPNSTVSILKICKNYNEDNCQIEDCRFLHLCVKFLAEKCPSDKVCKLSHNILDSKVEFVLNIHGISTKNKNTTDILFIIINIPSVKHSIVSLNKETSLKNADDTRVDSSKTSNTNKSFSDVVLPKTRWAHDLDGDIKVSKICFDSVESFCPNEVSGCDKLHCTSHFYWQVKVPVGNSCTWYNLSDNQAISLEKTFCNPNILTTKLPVLDPSSSKKDLLLVLKGRSSWEANFKTMEINLVGGNDILKIRRLHSKACLFKWYFLDINKDWIEYGCSTRNQQQFSTINSAYIENIYKSKAASVDFMVGSCNYTLFFKNMSQKNLQTGIVRKVRRRPVSLLKCDDSDTNLPLFWEPMQTDERCKRVTLQTSSEEYKKIDNLVRSRANGNVYSIITIERVQNPFVFKAFQIKVQQMKAIYKNDDIIDIRQLFHGTGPDIVPKICDENFDWRLHGTSSGQLYGRGTYFAMQSSYSYGYARPDSNGNKFMFVAKVAVGTTTQGNAGITRPPINAQFNLPYDSTVDNILNQNIIVKYERQEYYPEYIVTMK